MIENFVHKGLERFSKTGCASGITSSHIPRLKAILALLTQAKSPFEIQDGSLHSIARASGNQRGIYALKVNANWRVTFRFNARSQSICDVDYVDYH